MNPTYQSSLFTNENQGSTRQTGNSNNPRESFQNSLNSRIGDSEEVQGPPQGPPVNQFHESGSSVIEVNEDPAQSAPLIQNQVQETKAVKLPSERTMNCVFGVSLVITIPLFILLLISTVQRAIVFFNRDLSAELLAQERFEQFKKLVQQGEGYYGSYMYQESLVALDDAEKRSLNVGINEKSAYLFRALYNMKGDIMQMEENYPEAEKYFNMTMEIVNNYYSDHAFYIIQSLTNIAELDWRRGRYEKSEGVLLHCLKLRENLDYKVIFGHLQLSSLYTEWGKLDKAREHLMKVFTRLEELPETDKLFYQGRYYRNLGKIQLKEGDIENAKEYYRNAFGLFEKALPKKNDLIPIYKKEYEKSFNETYAS